MVSSLSLPNLQNIYSKVSYSYRLFQNLKHYRTDCTILESTVLKTLKFNLKFTYGLWPSNSL